mmetsp:Transcript_77701/g.219713  ORF Transcript_77701/g.219713 Transcript_77701/m.219713 type:complete len:202 (+) Transcript_77701:355-960(+)
MVVGSSFHTRRFITCLDCTPVLPEEILAVQVAQHHGQAPHPRELPQTLQVGLEAVVVAAGEEESNFRSSLSNSRPFLEVRDGPARVRPGPRLHQTSPVALVPRRPPRLPLHVQRLPVLVEGPALLDGLLRVPRQLPERQEQGQHPQAYCHPDRERVQRVRQVLGEDEQPEPGPHQDSLLYVVQEAFPGLEGCLDVGGHQFG